jgi:hypothetical protein
MYLILLLSISLLNLNNRYNPHNIRLERTQEYNEQELATVKASEEKRSKEGDYVHRYL